MIRAAWHIAYKDIRLVLRCMGLAHTILLGWLLIFVFSLAHGTDAPMNGQYIAAIFWMASSFCLILISATIYALEEHNETRTASPLFLLPVKPSGWVKPLYALLCFALHNAFLQAHSLFFYRLPCIKSPCKLYLSSLESTLVWQVLEPY